MRRSAWLAGTGDYQVSQTLGLCSHIAVAAGENKVEAIIATEMNNEKAVLVTDEAAGRKIAKLIESHK